MIKKIIINTYRFVILLPKNGHKLVRQFLVWRYKNLTDRQFILLLSILVGFSSGVAAVILKNSVHFIQSLLQAEAVSNYENYLYFVYPAIGIFLTVLLVKYFIKRNIGHGIPSTLYAISKMRSKMQVSST